MRHVATLTAGALVGESALLSQGERRNATVLSTEECVVLVLDRKSFRELDSATLYLIAENTRYSAACNKEPKHRTDADMELLSMRTAHLQQHFTRAVHTELCRWMRYRKLGPGEVLVSEGSAASCLYVIISGSADSISHAMCAATMEEDQTSEVLSAGQHVCRDRPRGSAFALSLTPHTA
jgi:CRP-like cAMP-binding protein